MLGTVRWARRANAARGEAALPQPGRRPLARPPSSRGARAGRRRNFHGLMDIDTSRLLAAFDVARQALLDQRDPAGHWVGRLASSALSTATAVSALTVVSRYGKTDTSGRFADEPAEARLDALIVRGLGYLADAQNADGGWGDTDLSLSNIATTLLVKAAFRLTGMPADDEDLLGRADAYIDAQGGIPGLRRRYGRDKTFAVPILTNCALAGVVPWREVSALPFELACLPQHWFRFLRLPVVSYAIPALVAIGQAKFHFDPPWQPLRWLRRAALDKSLRVLEQMQPQSGGFLEATPLTSFVVMSLASIGHADHSVVRRGVEFLVGSAREDGSWPIDTNLATWNTTLSINALAAGQPSDGESFDVRCSMLDVGRSAARPERRTSNVQRPTSNAEFAPPTQEARLLGEAGLLDAPGDKRLLDWLLRCQLRQTHPYTGAAAGGWAWTDLSGGVPDADDTSGALLALSRFHEAGSSDEDSKERIVEAAAAGVNWLLDLQNSDGGWPTFCRGWGTMPFDRSATDLTAHALRALHEWRGVLASGESCDVGRWTLDVGRSAAAYSSTEHRTSNVDSATSLAKRIDEAIHRGFVFLRRSQHAAGSWTPLWFGNQYLAQEENPVYGTSRVLLAYRDFGRLDTPDARRGLQWLAAHQNLDGGWGGAALAGYGAPRRAGDSAAHQALGRLANGRRTASGGGGHETDGGNGPADEMTASRPSMRLHRPDHVTQGARRSIAAAPAHDEGKRTKAAGRMIDHPQSTVEETALAVEALCGAEDVLRSDALGDDASLAKALGDGVAWLVRAVETKHWIECSPIGLYFAKLWYYEKLYPLIFTVSALGTAVGHAARRTARQADEMDGRPVPPELAHPHPVSLTR